MTFQDVNPRQSFPELELKILKFWRENDTFRQSIENRKNAKEYTFYDGPPFATGLPHYGHILAGTIKDVIPRYQTMCGYKVERRFGWDCHGLPVENLIEKELGLGDKQAILEYGIGNFNEACRASVLRYANEWEKIVERMGRWVDFQNDYKTMDPEFMESVWWVFDQLWQKGLVYEGHKPMHICPRCSTPLSNFEVNLGYKEITDQSVVVKFRINSNKCEHKIDFLAWTTTPWTLPGNVALAVGNEIDYVFMKQAEHVVVLAKDLVGKFEKELDGYEEFKVLKGKHFVEKCFTYNPLFSYFADKKIGGAFRVVAGDFVTTEDGTGIVHIAPAFGEDDLNVAKENDLPFVQHVSMEGKFISEVTDFAGQEVKPKDDSMKTDRKIVEFLRLQNKVFEAKTYRHSYPHCWRCDTPLINYATSSWFVKVEEIKKKLLNNNQQIAWVPDHLKNGRFGKWLENARDWAISRNRYWGTPLPIWRCNNPDCKHTESLGSIAELEQKSGKIVSDIHKHFVDDLVWDCPKCANEEIKIFEAQTEVEIKDCQKLRRIVFGDEQNISEELDFDGKDFEETTKHFYAKIEDDLIGTCRVRLLKSGEWKVERIVVLKDKRNTGVGRKILNFISNQAFKNQIKELLTHAQLQAKHFWESAGFIPFGDTFEEVGIAHIQMKKEVKENLQTVAQMKRIEEVFDCWFESGSMPYAQKHYPFAYNRKLKNTYYVLRHGEGEHNVTNLISCDPEFGCTNTALTVKGEQEVRENVKILKNTKVDLIYSSDFLRTKQTAEILSQEVGVEIKFDKRLREFNVGKFHGKDLHEYENTYQKKETKWFMAPEGGETYTDVEKRMLDVLNEIEAENEGKTVVLVSHGDPLKILLGALNGEFKKITAYAACPLKGVPQKIELKKEEDFLNVFPADFIAEGLDQTRGWFYTLHVLAAALFDQPAFKNVIVNGIVLAEDGQKMSKSKQNYPDPNLVFENYGADAMRFYLMNSPVVRADDLRFSEHGVNEVVKGVILPLWNSYAFFVTYANIDKFEPKVVRQEKKNKLDRWILSALHQLILDVTKEMNQYDLQKAAQPIFGFIDNLTNWYIRRSRRRFWKAGVSANDTDKNEAYETLYEVLLTVSKIIAPFMPFIAEEIYQNLTSPQIESGVMNSVHLVDWPSVNQKLINGELNAEMAIIQHIVKLGLAARAKAKIKVRQPLQKIQLALSERYNLNSLQAEFGVIQEELNIKEIEVIQNAEEIAVMTASPDARKLGPKYGKEVQMIIREAKQGNFEKLSNGNYKILDFEILPEEIEVVYQGKEGFNVEADQGLVVALDTHLTEDLMQEGIARDLVRLIQDMRKEADYKVDDRIELFLVSEEAEILNTLTKFKEYIKIETLAENLILNKVEKFDLKKVFDLESGSIEIAICRLE